MGILLAACLTRAGREVTLLDHDPARAARLERAGLSVTDPEGQTWTARPQVRARLEGPCELAFLCVKAGATEAALAPVRAGGATLAVLQNGCERAAAVGALLADPSRVVGLVTSEGATLLGEGRVRHAGRGETQVGPLLPEGERRAAEVVERLSGAGWRARRGEVRQASWEKLLVNAAINALTGLLECPNGELLRSPAASALADQAAGEVARLARALGVPGAWSEAGAARAWREVAARTGANISSTLQDLRRGQTTEVRAINGTVARLAADLGLAAPLNEHLSRLVAAREELLFTETQPTETQPTETQRQSEPDAEQS